MKKAEILTWNGDEGVLDIYKLNGVDYGFVQFNDNCEIRNSNDDIYSLFAVGAQKIVGGYSPGRRLVENDPKDFENSLLMLGYGENNRALSEREITVRNLIKNKNFYTLTCADFTDDGRTDFFISNWGAAQKPDIYLNIGDSQFALVDPDKIPDESPDSQGKEALYADIDGDGYLDMLYATRALAADATSIQFRIYRGLRPISIADVL